MVAEPILSELAIFAGLPPEAVTAIARASVVRTLRRGDHLVRSGEPSETVYVVSSGRFEVRVAGGGWRSEIGPGELVGEIGFFARLPRTADVVAIRDSVVLELDRAGFDRLATAHPELVHTALVAVSRRLAETTRFAGTPARDGPIRTLAVVPAGGTVLPPWFVAGLRRRLAGRGLVIEAAEVDLTSGDEASIAARLHAVEQKHALVVFVADPADPAWSARALRQADAVLFAAGGDADPAPTALERDAFAIVPPPRRRLLTLRERAAQPVENTRRWLEGRDVAMVHHAAADAPADLASLLRVLAGRAVGFVAGGGGGFGPAQVGIVRAFQEAGLVFDVYGGTSFGSATATALAFGAGHDEIVEGIDDIFVKARAFSRRTFPRYSIVDHTVFDAALRARYGDLRMEDALRPVFAVATDLSENRVAILDRGPVWLAVRASAAIPAVLPPVVTPEGSLLVDGAVIDNVPLAPMKRVKQGPNLVVHFGLPEIRRYPVRYDDIPGRWRLLSSLASPAGRRRLPKLPSPVGLIQHALTFQQPAAAAVGPEDLLVSPPAFPGSSFLDFSRHRDVTEAGYRWGLALVEQLIRDGDPAFAALRGAAET